MFVNPLSFGNGLKTIWMTRKKLRPKVDPGLVFGMRFFLFCYYYYYYFNHHYKHSHLYWVFFFDMYSTIGKLCRDLLTEAKWLGTILPRIPVPIARDIEQKLKTRPPINAKPPPSHSNDKERDRDR